MKLSPDAHIKMRERHSRHMEQVGIEKTSVRVTQKVGSRQGSAQADVK